MSVDIKVGNTFWSLLQDGVNFLNLCPSVGADTTNLEIHFEREFVLGNNAAIEKFLQTVVETFPKLMFLSLQSQRSSSVPIRVLKPIFESKSIRMVSMSQFTIGGTVSRQTLHDLAKKAMKNRSLKWVHAAVICGHCPGNRYIIHNLFWIIAHLRFLRSLDVQILKPRTYELGAESFLAPLLSCKWLSSLTLSGFCDRIESKTIATLLRSKVCQLRELHFSNIPLSKKWMEPILQATQASDSIYNLSFWWYSDVTLDSDLTKMIVATARVNRSLRAFNFRANQIPVLDTPVFNLRNKLLHYIHRVPWFSQYAMIQCLLKVLSLNKSLEGQMVWEPKLRESFARLRLQASGKNNNDCDDAAVTSLLYEIILSDPGLLFPVPDISSSKDGTRNHPTNKHKRKNQFDDGNHLKRSRYNV